jgi:eukaryotic-like serine/threonine-protein kinase
MPPVVLDRYRILRPLATGGVGELWLAHDAASLKTVVVKTLRARRLDDADMRTRFLAESCLHLSLSHPGIVRAIDAGPWGDRHAIVLEHIDGVTLSELESTCGPMLPAPWVAHIGASVSRALAHLHAHKDVDGSSIVHQDVSPQNVMIDTQGRVVLIDLGLASSGVRARGVCQGKPAYMAPEQARADAVDGRTDQHALGLVLVEALTGRLPLDHVSDAQLLKTLARIEVLPIPSGIDVTLAPLLGRMLAVDVDKRLPSMVEVADVLDAWRCGRPAPDDLGLAVRRTQAARPRGPVSDETTTLVEGPR